MGKENFTMWGTLKFLALLPPPKHQSQMFWGMRSCLDISNSGYKIQSCSRADPTVLADKCYGSALAIAMDNESMEFTNILKEFLADPIRDELKLGRLTKIAWPEPSKSPSQEFRDLLASLPTDLVKLLCAKNGKLYPKTYSRWRMTAWLTLEPCCEKQWKKWIQSSSEFCFSTAG